MAKFVLAIDQGTTGTTVCLLDERGGLKGRVTEDFPQIYPRPGWVEHDPEAIWSSVTQSIQTLLAQARVSGIEVAAIGITNQRETVVAWDRRNLDVAHNAIVWQCRRTTEFCEKIKKKKLAGRIQKLTGLVVDPYFSASKMRWLLDHSEKVKSLAKSGYLAFGTIDSFLLSRLSGGKVHATDVSNASRTQLLNIRDGVWDDELCRIFGVNKSYLPEVQPSSGVLGRTLKVPGLPDGLPIAGIAGDQQAALFGQAGFRLGLAKCTFVTGSFLLLNTGPRPMSSKSGLLTTVAWQLKGDKGLTYALEGGAFVCGAAVQFLRDQLGFIQSSAEVEELARQVPSAEGVEFVPALTGLGAPYWDPRARGMICGLTRGSKRAHIARATLEALSLQNVDILNAMSKDLGKRLGEVRVDGGASSNDLLMQLQADYLGVKCVRPKLIETTVAGAAFLAGLGVGFWRDTKEIEKVWQTDREFAPTISKKQREGRLKNWHLAVERARFS